MYDNIGGKIKVLAKVLFIVETIISVLAGFILIAVNEDAIGAGIMLMIVYPIFVWISTWLLYGFGELIEKVCAIEKNTRGGTMSFSQAPADYERTKKLENLFAQGLITEEEFKAALAKGQ